MRLEVCSKYHTFRVFRKKRGVAKLCVLDVVTLFLTFYNYAKGVIKLKRLGSLHIFKTLNEYVSGLLMEVDKIQSVLALM